MVREKISRAVYLDEPVWEQALGDLERTVPDPPPSIAALLDAMRGARRRWVGVSARADNRWDFQRLLDTKGPLAFEGLEDYERFRHAAHAWARYRGHKVVTRTSPDGSGRVWLVRRAV